MRCLNFIVPAKHEHINLYICADWHVGSAQCDLGGIKRFVTMIADDPAGYWVAGGDLAEMNIIGSAGQSDIYDQKFKPSHQLAALIDILEPIAPKCIAMIEGNHGFRLAKAGLSPDHILACLLGLSRLGPDIEGSREKYYGISAQGRIKIGKDTNWRIYLHHGAGGGYTMGGKVNVLERMSHLYHGMDLYIGAHSHVDVYFSKRVGFIEMIGGRVREKEILQHFTGAGAGMGWHGSYAHRKGKARASKAQVILSLGTRQHHRWDEKKKHPDYFIKKFERRVFHF
jgi:hypothetical protein